MSVTKVLINPQIEEEIKLYYKISNWVNKYGFLMLAFLLSLVFVFLSFGNQPVVSYKTSILDKDNLFQDYIGKYPDIYKKFWWISFTWKYIFGKTKIKKLDANLWLWLFELNNYQVPSFISFNLFVGKNLINNDIRVFSKRYLYLLKQSKYNLVDFKLKKFSGKTLSVDEMKDKFNLYCLDTLLNNSLFCNANKYYAISTLEKNNSIDLSSSAYSLLFENLNISNNKKCDILKKIYSLKLNYSNIKQVVDKYCDNVESFLVAQDIVNNSNLNKIFIPTLPQTYEWQIFKLINQWVYIIKAKNISSDLILAHTDYVKKLMNNWSLDKKQIYLEYLILQILKNNSDWEDKVLSSIDNLIKWNPIIGFKWINYYISDLISNKDNDKISSILGSNQNSIVSVKEKLFKIIKNNYKKYFVLTAKPNNPGNIQVLTGNLLVYELIDNKTRVFQLPVELKVNLKDIIWEKFEIFDWKILHPKVSEYMKSKWISLRFPSTLDELSSYLSDVLSNYYLNWGKAKFDLCVKAKTLWFTSCSNNTITLNDQSLHLNIKFIFNKDKLVKVDFPDTIKITLDYHWAGKDIKTLDLGTLKRKINSIILKWDYNLYSINKINKIILDYISKNKQLYLSKLVWLSPKDLINIQDRLNKYLWANLVKIQHLKSNLYKLYFTIATYKIVALYDFKKNTILAIGLYSKKKHKVIPFWTVKLTLSDVDIEKLNSLKLDPDTFLKELNSNAFNTYLQSEKNN